MSKIPSYILMRETVLYIETALYTHTEFNIYYIFTEVMIHYE